MKVAAYQAPLLTAGTAMRTSNAAGDACASIDLRLTLLYGAPLPQQNHRSPVTVAAKQKRISQGRALDDLTRPFVVSGKLHAKREVCAPLNQ